MTQPSAGAWTETLKTAANTWQCDQMGHMNTRHIEALFDDASAYFFARICGGLSDLLAQGVGFADRKHSFEFLREIRAGDGIDVQTRVLRVGRSSCTLEHQMTNCATGELLASAESVTVCFDLAARAARPLPDAVRALAPV